MELLRPPTDFWNFSRNECAASFCSLLPSRIVDIAVKTGTKACSCTAVAMVASGGRGRKKRLLMRLGCAKETRANCGESEPLKDEFGCLLLVKRGEYEVGSRLFRFLWLKSPDGGRVK